MISLSVVQELGRPKDGSPVFSEKSKKASWTR